MNKFLFLFLISFTTLGLTRPEIIASYKIKAELLPAKKAVKGRATLTWKNTSLKPQKELFFHAYLNAFKNEKSTFIKEKSRDRFFKFNKKEAGRIEVLNIKYRGEILLPVYVQTDDLNKNDQSVFKVLLKQAVKPGESISLDLDFESFLPKVIARTGWDNGDFFFVGQWFPKIAVLEKDGTWNCHQFHANTEFYADFGDYDVEITAPKQYKIAATGTKLLEGNTNKTSRFIAKNVHDFAWVASPKFEVVTEKYKGITLNYYLMPEHRNLVERYQKSVKSSIDFFEDKFEKYPHPQISIIDPPIYASEAGGMEYPMLISCGSTKYVGNIFKFQEVVTIHEFGHQYFQGIMASNEFENSWLDEGFTQYYEGRVLEAYNGGNSVDMFGIKINDFHTNRVSYTGMKFPEVTEIRKNAWLYPTGTYGTMSYSKPANILRTLEKYMGRVKFDSMIRVYFNKHKFSHPNPEDFLNVLNESLTSKQKFLYVFTKEAIYTSKSVDYYLERINDKTYKIRRHGYLKLPVNVRINYKDGNTENFMVKSDTLLNLKTAINKISIDPEKLNQMDLNLNNQTIDFENTGNSFLSKYAQKWMLVLQYLFGF